jgi:hypothetical protein
MYTAVIVEPRNHPALELVLNNFNKNLDNRWTFLIYHGNLNKNYIEHIINKNNMYERCRLVSLNVDNLLLDDYNNLLYSDFYYENINTEIFLVFQTDTLISYKYKDLIYDFLQYDYVGAPWIFNNEVGNGGLSLRRKTKMIEKLKYGQKYGFTLCYYGNYKTENEDIFFSTNIKKNDININKPNFEDSKKFSVETIFSDISFGLHKPWLHLNNLEINIMKENFPELDELITLNN